MAEPIKYELGWRVNFRNPVKKSKKIRKNFTFLKFGSEEKAYAAAKQFIREVKSGIFEERKSYNESKIEAQIEAYNRYSDTQKSPNTMRNQRQMLSVFLRFTHDLNIRTLGSLSEVYMRKFKDYYFTNFPFYGKQKPNHKNKSDGKATWEKYRQILSAFFNWAVGMGMMERNLIIGQEFKLKAKSKAMAYLSKDEVSQIIEYLVEPEATFFRVLLYTGMRLSEAILMKWDNCNLQKKQIMVVDDTYRFSSSKICRIKSDERNIPIHPKLLGYLKILDQKNKYVFDSGENTPLYDPTHYWKVLRQATNELGIKPCQVHSFRHTFAHRLCQKNVDLGRIKILMGHSRIETTMRYQRFYPEDIKDAIETTDFE